MYLDHNTKANDPEVLILNPDPDPDPDPDPNPNPNPEEMSTLGSVSQEAVHVS